MLVLVLGLALTPWNIIIHRIYIESFGAKRLGPIHILYNSIPSALPHTLSPGGGIVSCMDEPVGLL